MSGSIKKLAYNIANDLVLAPFGLKLSFNIGNNPIQDMARLLKDCQVSHIVDGGLLPSSPRSGREIIGSGGVIRRFDQSE